MVDASLLKQLREPLLVQVCECLGGDGIIYLRVLSSLVQLVYILINDLRGDSAVQLFAQVLLLLICGIFGLVARLFSKEMLNVLESVKVLPKLACLLIGRALRHQLLHHLRLDQHLCHVLSNQLSCHWLDIDGVN